MLLLNIITAIFLLTTSTNGVGVNVNIGFQPVDIPEVTPEFNYYWRDYDGRIPEDAVPGGVFMGTRNTYVGQMFVQNYGLIPGYIVEGSDYMSAIRKGLHTSKYHIKCLCSMTQQRLRWITVTNDTLTQVRSEYHLPLGGRMDEYSNLNIGRVQYQGDIIVGKVTPSNLLWFVYHDTSQNSNAVFQVLAYT